MEQRNLNDQLQEFGGKTRPTNKIKEHETKIQFSARTLITVIFNLTQFMSWSG